MAVAIANKLARIAWALMARGDVERFAGLDLPFQRTHRLILYRQLVAGIALEARREFGEDGPQGRGGEDSDFGCLYGALRQQDGTKCRCGGKVNACSR